MSVGLQPTLTQPQIVKLQRIRSSVLALRDQISALPAKERNNAHNEQFNQLRLEAKALLQSPNFDKQVPRAVTEAAQAERARRKTIPRLFMVITLGVILALLGLGINAIILEDVIVNSIGCVISTIGFFMVMASFGVFQASQVRRRDTNYGELYAQCETLLGLINQAIGQFGHATKQGVPSVLALLLDSLHKQVDDWQSKLSSLETQRSKFGANEPIELTTDINFVQAELDRVRQEIQLLNAQGMQALPSGETADRTITPPSGVPVLASRPVEPEAPDEEADEKIIEVTPSPEPILRPTPKRTPAQVDSDRTMISDEPAPTIVEKAKAHTLGMPPVELKQEDAQDKPDNVESETSDTP